MAVLAVEAGEFLADSSEENFREVTSMALVDRALRSAGLGPADIHRLAIGIGPGSYAGVRSAIAIAQGWQLARGTQVAAVPSLDVVANEAFHLGLRGEIEIIADAQRQEMYSQVVNITDSGAIEVKQPLAIKSPGEVDTERIGIGPEASRFVPSARDIYPTATALARMAARDFTPVAAESLVPIYLRETAFVKAPAARVY